MFTEQSTNLHLDSPSFSEADYYEAVYGAVNFGLEPINSTEADPILNQYQEEANLITSFTLTRFRQKHPGLGEREINEYGAVVYSFAFATARMEHSGMRMSVDGREQPVIRLAALTNTDREAVLDSLEPKYLATVHSRERQMAELALSEWYRSLED